MKQERLYPVVRLGPDAGARLDWENSATLLVLQATQGLIGPEILGVSVEVGKDEVIIHICLREMNEAVAEDLDDIVAAFDAFQAGVVEPPAQITVTRFVGNTDSRWPGYTHRRIFLINDRVRNC